MDVAGRTRDWQSPGLERRKRLGDRLCQEAVHNREGLALENSRPGRSDIFLGAPMPAGPYTDEIDQLAEHEVWVPARYWAVNWEKKLVPRQELRIWLSENISGTWELNFRSRIGFMVFGTAADRMLFRLSWGERFAIHREDQAAYL